MPPPRLSRHLRPCHPPVTAKQVRCVHTTGRAKLSTTGNDTTPQTPSAKGSNGKGSALSGHTASKNEISAEEQPWWKKALGHVALFRGHSDRSVSIESQSEPSPSHVEQPGHAATNLPEANGVSVRGKQGTAQPVVGSTASQQYGETQQGQMRFAESRKDHFPSSEQADMETLKQQIQQLSEQMKALQARLGAGLPTAQSSSTSATVPHTSRMRRKTRQFTVETQDLAYPTQTLPQNLLSKRNHSLEMRNALRAANHGYTRSVTVYATAARQLSLMPHQIVAPFASAVLRNLLLTRRIAMMDDDVNVVPVSKNSSAAALRLRDILNLSSLPVPRTDDPLIVNEVAKYSKMLSYDNPIAHTLDGCCNRYRLSSFILSSIASELESFRSPMIAPIARRIREHLLTVAESLYLEGDQALAKVMGERYDVKYLLGQARKSAPTKSPGLILRLESVCAYKATMVCDKRIRNLTKELARVLPEVSLFSYMQAPETLAAGYWTLRGSGDVAKDKEDRPKLTRLIHTQSRSMKSSTDLRFDTKDRGLKTVTTKQPTEVKDRVLSNLAPNAEASPPASTPKPSKRPRLTDEVSEQSLLEELFPETNSTPPPRLIVKDRDQYPRLKPPKSTRIGRPVLWDRPGGLAEQAVEPFPQHRERTTVLQLTNCSTGLTLADFRRIIPKGKHLEGWRRDSDFYRVIPGRDPLSLERLPFYYLLFRNTEAALSYQKNASRLHKLSARYQPSSILSAIPPPKGFLEDGEDIAAAVSSYNLLPKNHALSLNVVMQPYNPALRQLIERGGYWPIVPMAREKGKPIDRVLLHIEGYEPSPSDLFTAITRDAYRHVSLIPLRNESQSSIHRLRDLINLKMSVKAVSSSRPRAYGTFDQATTPFANAVSASEMTYDDPEIQNMMGGAEEDRTQAQMNQEIMNRVYNRWVLDFDDKDSARRWSLRWHRRLLPDPNSIGESAWKDGEEARICNTEVLW